MTKTDMGQYAQGVTVDQLQVFVAVVDAGSFSAASRQLRRTQGGISYHVSALEEQLGVALFDRSTRTPKLTSAGALMVAHARRVLGGLQEMRATGIVLGSGVEARLDVVVNVLFPRAQLARVLGAFHADYPQVDVHVSTAILRGVSARLLDARAELGVISHIDRRDDLHIEPCGTEELVAVVGKGHPLAGRRRIDDEELQDQVHLILGDDDVRPENEEIAAFPSPRRWRVDEVSFRLELLRAGLCWARMPRHLIEGDLAAGTLVPLRAKRWQADPLKIDFFVARLRDRPLGPAGQRLWQAFAEEAKSKRKH